MFEESRSSNLSKVASLEEALSSLSDKFNSTCQELASVSFERDQLLLSLSESRKLVAQLEEQKSFSFKSFDDLQYRYQVTNDSLLQADIHYSELLAKYLNALEELESYFLLCLEQKKLVDDSSALLKKTVEGFATTFLERESCT